MNRDWNYLHENHKKEAKIHWQVQQIANKFQVKCVYSFSLPLSFHQHVTNIEYIFHKGWYCCCCQYHVPVRNSSIIAITNTETEKWNHNQPKIQEIPTTTMALALGIPVSLIFSREKPTPRSKKLGCGSLTKLKLT